MKHHNLILQFALELTCVVFLASCDPAYDEDVAIKNNSSHRVTVLPSDYCFINDSGDSTIVRENQSHVIEAGEAVVVESTGGLGSASREEGVWMARQYLADSVVFQFDGARKVVYHKEDTTGISPYNFNSENYVYEEELVTGMVFHGNPYYGKLTFILTDEHYNMAN